MDQHTRILHYMETHKGITPMDAFHELGITKLATRIGEMTRKGIKITKIWEEGVDRYGDPTRYKRYFLERK